MAAVLGLVAGLRLVLEGGADLRAWVREATT